MTRTLHDTLHKRLSALLATRDKELQGVIETANVLRAATAVGAEVTDFKEMAAQDVAASMDESHLAHAAEQLSQVQAARRRLHDGTYGFCADCGEPIDERRLLAVPETARCMACQAAHEPRHAH